MSQQVRYEPERLTMLADVFVLSVPVTMVAPHRAAWVWLLLAVVQPIAGRLGGRRATAEPDRDDPAPPSARTTAR